MAEGGGSRSQKKRSSIVALMESSYPKLDSGITNREPHPNSREARTERNKDVVLPPPGQRMPIPGQEGDENKNRKQKKAGQVVSQEIMMQHAFELYKKYTTNPDDDYVEEAEELRASAEGLVDEGIARFVEAKCNVAISISKKHLGHFDEELTSMLVGQEAYDGIVFDENFKDPYRIESAFKKGADPMARDFPIIGNTIPHIMAANGTLRWHTEAWHIDRINSLRKKGCDSRSAPDYLGRPPLLLGFENYNVHFVKSILKGEMGDTWASKVLKRVPAYAPGGDLMQKLLKAPKPEKASGGRRRGDEFTEKLKADVELGNAKAIYRLREGGWLTGLHWAAYHDNPNAVFLLYILGLPVDVSNYIPSYEEHKLPLRLRRHSIQSQDDDYDIGRDSKYARGRDTHFGNMDEHVPDDDNVHSAPGYIAHNETPLLLAVSRGNLNAVAALLKCKADPFLKNSKGESPISLAQKLKGKYPQMLGLLNSPPSLQEKDMSPYEPAAHIGFDAVLAAGQLLEAKKIPSPNVESMCNWYLGLGIHPWLRVERFWKVYCDWVKGGKK